METKEELLVNLKDAVSILGQLSNVQQRLNEARSQYKQLKKKKKMTIIAKACIVITFLLGLIVSFQFDEAGMKIGMLFVVIFWTAIVFAFFKVINILRNRAVNNYNQMATEGNEAAQIQEQSALKELQKLQIVYQERLASWYPENYCCLDAAEFFYDAIKNYRADNLKEAVNLYETTLHQRRVEDNQKQAIRQQKLNNLLTIGNLAMQTATLGAINNQTASMQNAMNDQTSAINRNTDALRGIKDKLSTPTWLR